MNPEDLFTLGVWWVILTVSIFAVWGILKIWIYLHDREDQ